MMPTNKRLGEITREGKGGKDGEVDDGEMQELLRS